MPLQTPLTHSFGLTAPIVSAPMAGIAGGALAAAVTRAGGLGLIGGGYGDRAWIEREFDNALGEKVGIGFIAWALARQPDDLLAEALERRPRAVLLSFGDVQPFAPAIAKAGIPLIAQIQTVRDARIAVAEGASVIVAQGTEAGEHSGERATMALVPAVVDAVVPVPVVAACGIADGRGLAAALMLGATGVLCGPHFTRRRNRWRRECQKASHRRLGRSHGKRQRVRCRAWIRLARALGDPDAAQRLP